MVDASFAEPRFRDIVVVGGGCYGSFYAQQLVRARERGAIAWRTVLVVDRDAGCKAAGQPAEGVRLVVQDWGTFFDQWLDGTAGSEDAIVPSPLMPHLLFEWLGRRARMRWPGRVVTPTPVDSAAGTPYDVLNPDGTRYLSFADWICPVHCIEPLTCPMIRAPRTWEMAEAVAALCRRRARDRRVAGPVLFRCRHRAYGVGMIDVSEVLAGDALVAEAGGEPGPFEAIVGTISSCHGAVSGLAVGPG